ncbi:carboxylesterase family protein [Klebsiella pneumoniae subsp. pneumoniae]|nr:carboxylesterase family protein [Klebsiella pneumoniae subsp. pneumoniae]
MAKTRQGTLAGSARTGRFISGAAFPYAAPPVGPLRWRAPQPAARWQGVRPAETFSAASWQDIDYCRELRRRRSWRLQRRLLISQRLGPGQPQRSRCR